jgi:hypothetical protein
VLNQLNVGAKLSKEKKKTSFIILEFLNASGYLKNLAVDSLQNREQINYLNQFLIKKNGLINKSKNFVENHPERIYFFYNIEDGYDYANFKNLFDFSLLKIDCKTLNNIKLFEDPKYYPYVKAYYTYDNIPPYAIEII